MTLSLPTIYQRGLTSAAYDLCCFCLAVQGWCLSRPHRSHCLAGLIVWGLLLLPCLKASAEVQTWDGRHSITKIDVEMVYFVPKDRTPLPDWLQRLEYFQRRLQQFHAREYGGQSQLVINVRQEPFISRRSTQELRVGDGDAIFFKTLQEVDRETSFADPRGDAFPILLVMSDINWRPLDDFYRLSLKEDHAWEFEGNYREGRHFPGAASGGSRATYLTDRGVGWGLVSADGWRVPYTGSDCVVYHEGVGHTVGLPHPEPGNGSVMSQGQYQGWINQSWLDDEQKLRMGWERSQSADSRQSLFNHFTVTPDPAEPKPQEPVELVLTLPNEVKATALRVRTQTSLWGPWVEVGGLNDELAQTAGRPTRIALGSYDRPTPISYRVDIRLEDGQEAELWGYFQVRDENGAPYFPTPGIAHTETGRSTDLISSIRFDTQTDLLAGIIPAETQVRGDWQTDAGTLISPKQLGARLELNREAPVDKAPYRIIAIIEPLDEPNGFVLGHALAGRQFLTIFDFDRGAAGKASAIENIDGQNIGNNASTFEGNLFKTGRLSQVACTVTPNRVTAVCDGVTVFDWSGDVDRLTLQDYWKTPHPQKLFIGSYHSRFKIHQLTLLTLSAPKPQ